MIQAVRAAMKIATNTLLQPSSGPRSHKLDVPASEALPLSVHREPKKQEEKA
jgi:hypothetical protein